MAYINKKPINFQNEQESKIKKLIRDEFGDWYSSKISIAKVPHLKANEVESLIDPNGFNLTFSSTKELKKIAGGWVAQEYRENIFRLTTDDFLFIDCCREMRNAIAHKSKRSFDSMNKILRTVPTPSTIEFINRPENDIHIVGAFLKAKPRGKLRVISCIERFIQISNKM